MVVYQPFQDHNYPLLVNHHGWLLVIFSISWHPLARQELLLPGAIILVRGWAVGSSHDHPSEEIIAFVVVW